MRKTLITLIVLVSLLFSFNISYASQYPMRENYYHDGVNIIERIYELDTDQEPSAEAKQSFERDGYFYTLVSITKNEKSEVDEKDYRETITVDSSSKNIGDILPLLAKEKEFTTADGYQGVLKLDESSIKVETKGYKSSSKTIQAYRTYPNLLNADLAYIPKTITEDGEVLELADISWERDLTYNPDDYAIGERYIANALYQGIKTYSYASGYLVSADYAGKVTKEIDTKDIYTLTFNGEKEHSLLLIGLISVCGGALVVLGVLLYRRQRNGIEEENEEESTEEEITEDSEDEEGEQDENKD